MTLPGGTVISRRFAALAALAGLLPFAAFGAVSASAFTVFPPPGLYSEPQLLNFSVPADSRLEITVDGISYDRSQGPLYLDTPVGTEREWRVSLTVRSAVPSSGAAAESVELLWRIDRKKPSAPLFVSEQSASGQQVTLSLNEAGLIRWKIWHPRFVSESGGTSVPGNSVIVPYGAVLCAWGIDAAGNTGPAASFAGVSAPERVSDLPYKIINPVPGSWANRQSLVIDRREDLTVRYTIDGSDPAADGFDYSGPVRLEADGVIVLRVLLEDPQGHSWTSKILYSVTDPVPSPVAALSGSGAVTETGEFAEFFVSEGLSWGIGDGVPKEPGGKAVLFTGVRALHSWYPLTVSDGAHSWRHVIGCGSTAPASVASTDFSAQTVQPVRIHDWYFISIEGLNEVFASVDGTGWKPCTEPLLIDRSAGHRLEWYSPSWKNGAVQTVQLPPKPALSGLPVKGLTAEPVFISEADPDWDLHYRAAPFPQSSTASLRDPQLSSGLLVEVPSGAEAQYRLSFLAVYGGIVHGTLEEEFSVDRKTPRMPTISFDTDSLWSRTPVRVTVSGEDRLETIVEPAARQTGTGVYILEGSPDYPVTYKIRSGAVDAAGNRGGTAERTVTVDRNAIYVDPGWIGIRGDAPDGSPQAPYTSLDLALETIRDTGSWRVYLAGNAKLSKPHTLQADIRLIGSGFSLEIAPEALLTVSSGALRLESCRLTADLSALKTAQALITVQNGALALNNVSVSVQGPDSMIFLRGSLSDIRAAHSDLSLTGGAYAAAFDLKSSKLSMESSTISAAARSVSALSLVSSKAEIRASSITVVPVTASRALEAWSSELILDSVTFQRATESGSTGGSAIWTDADTSLNLTGISAFPGFKSNRETAPR